MFDSIRVAPVARGSVLVLGYFQGEGLDRQSKAHDSGGALSDALKRGEATGFCTEGLFAWSRHPNFFFEQAQWWVLVAFAATSTGNWLQPSALGAFLLTLLFFGSTRFTEELTLKKYPSYAEYQRTTPRWGWWPGR